MSDPLKAKLTPAEKQEAALLAIFRSMSERARINLLRQAKAGHMKDMYRAYNLLKTFAPKPDCDKARSTC